MAGLGVRMPFLITSFKRGHRLTALERIRAIHSFESAATSRRNPRKFGHLQCNFAHYRCLFFGFRAGNFPPFFFFLEGANKVAWQQRRGLGAYRARAARRLISLLALDVTRRAVQIDSSFNFKSATVIIIACLLPTPS